MNKNFYDYLKEKYDNVVYYNCRYICQNKHESKYNIYTDSKINLMWDTFNKSSYCWIAIDILENNNVREEYLKMFEEEIEDTDKDIRDLLAEWVKYKVISKKTYDIVVEELVKELTKGAIFQDGNYILTKEK
jgi:hypothetical protein